MEMATPARKKCQHTRNLGITRDFSQPDGVHVGKRHHDSHTAVDQPQQIELFKLRAEGAAADVLDGPYPLIRVYHPVTDFEGHTEKPSLYHRCLVVIELQMMRREIIISIFVNVNTKFAESPFRWAFHTHWGKKRQRKSGTRWVRKLRKAPNCHPAWVVYPNQPTRRRT